MSTNLVLEGIEQVAFAAEFALRMRVSISAMGSVMLMTCPPIVQDGIVLRFAHALNVRATQASLSSVNGHPVRSGPTTLIGTAATAGASGFLPAGLGYTGELTTACQLAQTHTAEPELAVKRPRTAAAGAAVVLARRELRSPLRLGDHRFLSHFLTSNVTVEIHR